MSDFVALLAAYPLPKWLLHAFKAEGLHEIPGVRNNPELMKILDLADGVADGKTLLANDDDEAYCAKGMCACYELGGVRSPRTARARDFLDWGQPLGGPAIGCTAVLERGPVMGHVTFPIGRTEAGDLVGFGFNQSDGVRASVFDPQRILGYRYPSSLPAPKLQSFLSLPVLKLQDGRVSSNEA